MKILQINTTVNSGSTGRIAEDIGKVALKNSYESYISFGRGNQTSESELIRIGSKKGFYVHVLKSLFLDMHGRGSKNETKSFIRKVKEYKPEVVGLHNIHGYYINYQVLFEYLKEQQLPVIWTFHDCWPFTGHCAYFEAVKCEKWMTHCEKCPLTDRYPKSFVDRSYSNFDNKKEAFLGLKNLTIVTPSYWLKNKVEKSFFKGCKVEVIHNGVDLNRFKVLNITSREDKIILGVASIWDKRKGLDDFITLRSLLTKEYKIVLIGLSKNQIASLPEGVLGIERTESVEELVNWYNKATVFVNPTYIDNFPTTNVESLACGTPVITYDTGGSPESIDGETGIVVEQGNVFELKESIENICSKRVDYYSHLCRQRAMKLFNKDDRFQEYINLYEKLSEFSNDSNRNL
jgi:putative colanic acid biosynthesis glycosyltransferase